MFFVLLLAQGVFAQREWTVKTVPNTRLQNNSIHVSDPDGFLSDSTEMVINTALCAIRDTVDVFLVTLRSIGNEEPAVFRYELFNYWGIGDKNKDNGLLLLFVEDQHALEFETGYGIESVMTDMQCQQIFTKVIVPYFKKGDYETGLCAGVAAIVKVFGGTIPQRLERTLPDPAAYTQSSSESASDDEMSNFFLWVMFFILIGIPGTSFFYYLHTRKKEKDGADEIKDGSTIVEKDGVKYVYDAGTTWTGSAWQGKGCSRALTFGVSGMAWLFVSTVVLKALMEGAPGRVVGNWVAVVTLVSYFSFICIRHNRRLLKMSKKVAADTMNPKKVYELAHNHFRTKLVNYLAPWFGIHYMKEYNALRDKCPEMRCPTCGKDMQLSDGFKPSDLQMCEEKIGTRRYVSLSCPEGHSFVKVDKGKKFSSYKKCSRCQGITVQQTQRNVLKKPTYVSGGLDELIFTCAFCGAVSSIKVSTPKLERSSSSSSSSGSSSHSSGSFGGGHSGGGGYSGRW